MRSTIVPAQITSVEDKIAGNIGVTQLALLVVPLFGASGIFVALPPFFNYANYKMVIIVCFAALSCALAIRIKEKILLTWLVVLLRHHTGPTHYIFNKNDSYLREPLVSDTPKEVEAPKVSATPKLLSPLPQLSSSELVKIEEIMTDPQAKLHFKTDRKGELRVYITETT